MSDVESIFANFVICQNINLLLGHKRGNFTEACNLCVSTYLMPIPLTEFYEAHELPNIR